MRWLTGFLVVLVLLAAATGALAVDGVLEINQACAENTGCFEGDTLGFPVTITAPGSYRLTGNVDGIGMHAFVVEIAATGVTLDLNAPSTTFDNSSTKNPERPKTTAHSAAGAIPGCVPDLRAVVRHSPGRPGIGGARATRNFRVLATEKS